jgi:hypothetical protein
MSWRRRASPGQFALRESVRQMRGTAPAQTPGAKISVRHGVRGMFAESGAIIILEPAALTCVAKSRYFGSETCSPL